MVNTLELRAAIVRSGYTQEDLADKLDVTLTTLNYKINNRREFKGSEIKKLAELLSLTSADVDGIFFAG